MLIVHHLNNSRSQRVLWILEELGLEYEVKFYNRNDDMTAPSSLKSVHPLGKAPILEDRRDDGRHLTLVETAAIIEYLVERADGELGSLAREEDRLRYRQFLHYAEGSVMPVMFALLVASKIPIFGKAAARKVRPMLDVHLSYIEGELASRPWFAGEKMTAADIMMSFPLEAAHARLQLDDAYPATSAWLDRIHQRPAYIRAMEKGGRYAYAT